MVCIGLLIASGTIRFISYKCSRSQSTISRLLPVAPRLVVTNGLVEVSRKSLVIFFFIMIERQWQHQR